MATTPNMSLVKPTEGGDSGTWDTLLNAIFDLIDLHDHSSGKGVQVPSLGIGVDADLTFAGFAATSLKSARFSAQSDLTAETLGIGVKSGELYWVTSGGTEVQLTNGTSLNTSLVGGITGDYTTTNADCEYVDADKAFEFKQDETPDFWARLKCGDIRLFEAASGITNYVQLKSPNSLAATYDLSMPPALPGAGVVNVLEVDENGAVTLGPAVDSGGTELLKHAEVELVLDAAPGNGLNFTIAASGAYVSASSLAFEWYINIPVLVGKRITQVDYRLNRQGVNTTMVLERKQFGTATPVHTASTDSSSVGDSTNQVTSINHTVLTANSYRLKFTAAGANPRIYGATVYYDHV